MVSCARSIVTIPTLFIGAVKLICRCVYIITILMFAVLAPHPGRTAQLHNYIREAWLLPTGSNICDVDDDDDEEMMIKE